MKRNNLFKIIGVITVVAVVGLGANAFADRGMRDGKGGGYGYDGHGMERRCNYGYGPGANLSEADRKEMDQLRESFFNETEKTRRTLYAKRLELRAELAKETPDTDSAARLQKEISALQTDLDQKHLSHVFSMRKINPNAGRGFGCQDGRAGGHGMRGNCWR